MKKSDGFTLVELLVAMAIFGFIATITMNSFQHMLKNSSQQSKSAEGAIAGVVGLEMMRADIVSAGYGLPWSFTSPPSVPYGEVTRSSGFPDGEPVDGITLSSFNEATPRALSSGIRSTTGSSYLVIKSVLAGMTATSRKWSYLPFQAPGPITNPTQKILDIVSSPPYAADPNWASGDQAIVINPSFATDGTQIRQLVQNPSGGAGGGYAVTFNSVLNNAFVPTSPTSTYLVYGLGTTAPLMPWNRVDYYIDNTNPKNRPTACSPGSGVLNKSVANHSGGVTTYPILDCVGDLQVVYFLDMDDDGTPGTYYGAGGGGAVSSTEPTMTQLSAGGQVTAVQATLADPSLLRNRLKQVMVYVLAHEGKRDPGFTYPERDPNSVITVGPAKMPSLGRVWTDSMLNNLPTALTPGFGPTWSNYRWKVYSFTVNLQNLL